MAPTVKKTLSNTTVVNCQAPVLGCCRPAQWLFFNHKSHASVEWKIQGPGKRSILDGPAGLKNSVHNALTVAAESQGRNFVVVESGTSVSYTGDEQTFKFYFFTPYYQWVDVITGKLSWSGDGTGTAKFTSSSASAAPAR